MAGFLGGSRPLGSTCLGRHRWLDAHRSSPTLPSQLTPKGRTRRGRRTAARTHRIGRLDSARRSLKMASDEQVLATGDAHQLQLRGEWLLQHTGGIRSRLQVENFLPTQQTTSLRSKQRPSSWPIACWQAGAAKPTLDHRGHPTRGLKRPFRAPFLVAGTRPPSAPESR